MATNENYLMKYQGGKAKLAKHIIPYFPAHKIYIELFAGALGMFLNKIKSETEIINDFNGDLTNLFEVIRTNKNIMLERMKLLTVNRGLFYYFKNKITTFNDIDRAIATLYLYQYSFGGTGGVGGFGTRFGKGGLSIEDLMKRVSMAHNRLKQTIIENRDYKDMFKLIDNKKDVFIYLDPPYFETNTQGYSNKLINHNELIELVLNSKHKCIISHTDNELYNKSGLYKLNLLTRVEQVRGNNENKECLYSNFEFKANGQLFYQ